MALVITEVDTSEGIFLFLTALSELIRKHTYRAYEFDDFLGFPII